MSNLPPQTALRPYLDSLARIADQQSSTPGLVCHIGTPEDFQTEIDLSLAAPEGVSLKELETALSSFLQLNPDVSRLGFHKQLYSGINLPAVLGEWVATLSNSVMHTFNVGPVSTLMEQEVIRQLCGFVGFSRGEGLMVSGASQANLVSMMLARHARFPDLKNTGYGGRSLVAFVSDQAHYSMQRAANVLGIGLRNLIAVPSDEDGRMCPIALKRAILEARESGKLPFYLGLTAGTTVVGAFDPVAEAMAVARDFGLWVHVDGAWGAPVLFSDSHRHLLSGCAEADSFTWDAHKLLNVPLTAGIILTRERGHFHAATSGGGENYLFHRKSAAPLPTPELGELSIQSARRADCVKVWAAWKAAGHQGFARKVDSLMAQKTDLLAWLDAHPRFEVIAPAPYLNVLFQYRPASEDWTEAQLGRLNTAICTTLAESGEAFIDYAQFGGRTGIRMILAHPDIDAAYLGQLCERIAVVAEELIADPMQGLPQTTAQEMA